MNRKNTILIAVMVNAGLLVFLFVAALTTQETGPSAPGVQMAESSPAAPEPFEVQKPLFGESADFKLRQSPLIPEQKPLVIKPVESAPPVEAPVLHVLPPLAPEQAPAAPAVQPSAPAAPSSQSAYVDIVVKKGDTLDKIAKTHRTTAEEIIRFNRLPSSFLKVGQQLKIPTEKAIAAPARPKAAPMAEQSEYYTIKVGDNPWTIAMKHHMKVDELLKLNGLNEEKARKLKPGDRLRTK